MEDMRDILPGVRDKMVDAWREGVGDMEEEDITNLIVWAPEFEMKNAMILTRWHNLSLNLILHTKSGAFDFS